MFFIFCFSNGFAIQNDSIIVNQYSEVTEIYNDNVNNKCFLKVKEPEKFKTGDTIIIYQAKGVDWQYNKESTAKIPSNGTNFAGRFEYHIVLEKTGDTIILEHSLSIKDAYKFQKEFLIQIIKVPSLKKYIANKTLTASPWNGVKGGIIAMIVDTLELNANIDVTGKGFHGGDPSRDKSIGLCINSDSINLLKPSYSYFAKDSSGLKGESVVMFDSLYMRGRNCLYNGGGGGNGYHSGGGGGANYRSGGYGGGEAANCFNSSSDAFININWRAIGGYSIKDGPLNLGDVRAFLGGGGGSSTRIPPSIDYSKGGNGGGIILLMANVIRGNGHSIIANGQTVKDTSSTGGGGGGGGGSILLDINKFEGNLNVSVVGGNGGWTKGSSYAGPGGGGGGGYIWYNSKSAPTASIVTNLDSSGISGANTFFGKNRFATNGEFPLGRNIKYDLKMPLSSFLFNILPPDTTICAGEKPHVFNASHPKGGDGKYKFKWLKYTWNKNNTTIKFDTIPGANDTTYQESSPLYDTTYYLRVVKVHNPYFPNDTIVDQSLDTLKVFVVPVINNNKIFSADTAKCKGIALPKITGSYPNPSGSGILKLSGGNNKYSYQWQILNSKWLPASGDSSNIDYLPKQTNSISIRRFVRSSACNSISNSINLVVLPKITNNLIADTQWVCKGIKPDSLYGIKKVGGGDTIHHQYFYKWQERKNNKSWIDVATYPDRENHILPYLSDTMYYRRWLYSGQDSTCRDSSNILKISILDSIENNFIRQDTNVICGNTKPNDFLGSSTIKGGDKKYSYQWEQNTNLNSDTGWTIIRTIKDTITFNPGIMFDTTKFRRIALSGPNDCCKSISSPLTLFVRPFIKNNKIINPDTTICYNQSPGNITVNSVSGGDGPYKYTWLQSVDNNTWKAAPGVDTLDKYLTGTDTVTTYYRRKIKSGVCIDLGSVLKVKVLPLISGNIIGPDTAVCKGTSPDALKEIQHTTGGDNPNYKYLWLAGNDSTNLVDIGFNNTNSYYYSDTLSNIKYFKRVIKSGLHDCCVDTSNILKVGIYQLPTGTMLSSNDSLCLGSDYSIFLTLTGRSKYKFTYSDSKITNAIIDAGENYILKVKPGDYGIYYYNILSLVDANNCSAKVLNGTDALSVFMIPDAKAGIDTSVCGLTVRLNATPSIGIGTWSASGSIDFKKSDSIPNALAIAHNYGLHTLTWTENNGGCIDKDSIKVTFFEQPTSGFAGKDTSYPYLFQVKLNALAPAFGKGSWSSLNKSIYFENPADPSSYADSLKFGSNYLIWTIVNGVCDTISDTIEIIAGDLRIPQGFSPNNDGINDRFEIRGLENVKNAELYIINKWGAEIYHSNNYQNDWDGTKNGSELPEDTYYYILRVIGQTYKGFIIIRR